MHFDHPLAVAAVVLALALGGLMKGATGAGAPVIAVPVIAAFFDIRFAVALMAAPNLMTNLWQASSYRAHRIDGNFTWIFALAGGVGAILGTALLANLPVTVLQVSMAVIVLAYVALRLMRPSMRLSLDHARRIMLPLGLAAGALQGAAGISAPLSVSFLNAMRLGRECFIFTISVFFAVMSFVQLPVPWVYGLLSPGILELGLFAVIPLLVSMPVGRWLASSISPAAFDRIMLTFLTLLALRLIWTAFG